MCGTLFHVVLQRLRHVVCAAKVEVARDVQALKQIYVVLHTHDITQHKIK